MRSTKKIIIFTALFLIFFFRASNLFAEDIIETLNIIQKDLKTLEKAVYSGNTISSSEGLNSENSYSEDVLTRHLLKLSDIEKQFQELTNKFEEINFKIDKLSNRLSKIQSDNQLRFQDLEKFVQSGEVIKSTLSASKKKKNYQDHLNHKTLELSLLMIHRILDQPRKRSLLKLLDLWLQKHL